MKYNKKFQKEALERTFCLENCESLKFNANDIVKLARKYPKYRFYEYIEKGYTGFYFLIFAGSKAQAFDDLARYGEVDIDRTRIKLIK